MTAKLQKQTVNFHCKLVLLGLLVLICLFIFTDCLSFCHLWQLLMG